MSKSIDVEAKVVNLNNGCINAGAAETILREWNEIAHSSLK